MASNISDWVLSLDVDTASATKKIDKLEARIKKMASMGGVGTKSDTSSTSADTSRIRKNTSAIREQTKQLKRRNKELEKYGKLIKPVGVLPTPKPKPKEFDRSRAVSSIDKARGISRGIGDKVGHFSGMGGDSQKHLSTLNHTKDRIDKIRDALSKVKDPKSLRRLNRILGKLSKRANTATMALKAQRVQMHKNKASTNSLATSTNHLIRSYASVFAVLAAGRAFFQVGRDIQSTQAVMLAATGDAKTAAESFEFIKETSFRLGQGLKQSAASFAKFGAAARGAGLSLEEIKDMFTGISEVNMAFQLTTESSKLAFLAFEQMLSKGTVSMEELRRQLGERWPGAFKQAANSMGITTKEMNKLVASGQLMSKDFVGGFVKQMVGFVKESGAYEAALKKVSTQQGRFGNILETVVGEAFIKSEGAFAEFFKNLVGVLEEGGTAIEFLGRSMGGVASVLSTVALLLSPLLGLLTTQFTNLFDSIDRAVDLEKPLSELNFVEQIFRAISVAANGLLYVLASLALIISDLTIAMGSSEEDSLSWAKSLVATAVAIWSIVKAYKALKSVMGFKDKAASKLGSLGGAGPKKQSGGKKPFEKPSKLSDGFKKKKPSMGARVAKVGGAFGAAYAAKNRFSDVNNAVQENEKSDASTRAAFVAFTATIGTILGAIPSMGFGSVAGGMGGATLGEIILDTGMVDSLLGLTPSESIKGGSGVGDLSKNTTTTNNDNRQYSVAVETQATSPEEVSRAVMSELSGIDSQVG